MVEVKCENVNLIKKKKEKIHTQKRTCASGHIWPTTNPWEPPENLPSVNKATSCNPKAIPIKHLIIQNNKQNVSGDEQ